MGPFLSEWISVILKLKTKYNDDEISEYCLQVGFGSWGNPMLLSLIL